MSPKAVVFFTALTASSSLYGLGQAAAAEPQSIDLKSGETAELGTLFWVQNCKSILKATPTAEIMDGPPELSVTIKAQQVTPFKDNCAKPVSGGVLVLTASTAIKSHMQGKLFFRVKYQTKDGDRQVGREVEYNLFP